MRCNTVLYSECGLDVLDTFCHGPGAFPLVERWVFCDPEATIGTIKTMARREMDEWFWQLGAELQRLSEEMFRSGPTLASSSGWEPRVDVLEEREAIVVRAEIAGVRGRDIQIVGNAVRNTLVIRGVRNEDTAPSCSKTGFYQLEICYGEFLREVKLPEIPLDMEGIEARYNNGILLVRIPKVEAES